MRFSQIWDQKLAVETLRRAIGSSRVPHAYLFEGPQGVGKALTATTFAMALNCQSESGDACHECTSCDKILRDTHPDVRLLTTPEGKRRLSIEQVREAERWIAVSPHEGKAKVLLIDPADLMTEPAANALLKTLEEPREGSFLVLITSTASSLLPTVRSRCQTVRFRPLADETVARLLMNDGMPPDDAALVAALAQGSMARAADYSDEELPAKLELVSRLLICAVSNTPEDAMAVAAELRGDRDGTTAILEMTLLVLEELLWTTSEENEGAGVDSPLLEKMGEKMLVLVERSRPEMISAWVAAVHRALTAMKRNNMNPQLALEGLTASMRGRTEAGESWNRIGAR